MRFFVTGCFPFVGVEVGDRYLQGGIRGRGASANSSRCIGRCALLGATRQEASFGVIGRERRRLLVLVGCLRGSGEAPKDIGSGVDHVLKSLETDRLIVRYPRNFGCAGVPPSLHVRK